MERKSMCKCLPSYSPNIRMFPCKYGASMGNCSFVDLYYHSNSIRYYGHYFIHIRSSFFTKIRSSKKSPVHTLLDFGNLSWWVLDQYHTGTKSFFIQRVWFVIWLHCTFHALLSTWNSLLTFGFGDKWWILDFESSELAFPNGIILSWQHGRNLFH